jgi:hypothetical protein
METNPIYQMQTAQTSGMPTTMIDNGSVEYKPDRSVSKSDFDTKLENLRKIYNQAIESRWLWSGPKIIALEGEWTDNLKGLVRLGNSTVTKSISYQLAEKDEVVDIEVQQK